jgi:hypothetical protein
MLLLVQVEAEMESVQTEARERVLESVEITDLISPKLDDTGETHSA